MLIHIRDRHGDYDVEVALDRDKFVDYLLRRSATPMFRKADKAKNGVARCTRCASGVIITVRKHKTHEQERDESAGADTSD